MVDFIELTVLSPPHIWVFSYSDSRYFQHTLIYKKITKLNGLSPFQWSLWQMIQLFVLR